MRRRSFIRRALAVLSAIGIPFRISSAEDEPKPDDEAPLNLLSPTLGGKQFWADELFFHDWHIQRNVFTGHYRLLDGNSLRHAWGTFDQCRARLDEIKQEKNLPPMSGRAVLVLHGLFRSDSSMTKMARHLREQGKFTTFRVSYPSTRRGVEEHAKALASIIANLEGIEEINFVAHSLGNIVVRHYLADHTDAATGKRPDPRIKRMVMLGPPNCGAQIAEVLLKNDLSELVAGKSGQQLARDWKEFCGKLATPEFEFGIIAGGRKQERGYNPLLKGDNDAVVSVESARLPGATDFAVLPVIHSTMMDNATVQEYTLRFLNEGHFVSAETKQPIATAQ